MQRTLAVSLAAGLIASLTPAGAQNTKPVPNQTKGQGQLVGGNGQFGVVYSLKSGFNFAILGARYSIEPYEAYTGLTAGTDEKILVLDLAIKNTNKEDNFFNPDGLFTLVDTKGELIQGGSLRLMSKAGDSSSATLRPGQGLGQPELKDALQIAFTVPAKARIVKIMVNQQRLNRNEEVFRYYIAGATKEEAGEPGDPKNVIQPVMEADRDPADKSGAITLQEGKATVGAYVPSGYFDVRLDSFAFTNMNVMGDDPVEEGKKLAIATVTVKSRWPKDVSMFDVEGGDDPLYELTDADGERYKPVGYRKATKNEDPEHTFRKGDEVTFRVVFLVPKDAAGKKLIIGTRSSHKWAIDVSNVK
jgi:hypothetical protein